MALILSTFLSKVMNILYKLGIISPNLLLYQNYFTKIHHSSLEKTSLRNVLLSVSIIAFLCILTFRIFLQESCSEKFNYLTYNFTFIEGLDGKMNSLNLGFSLVALYFHKLMRKRGLMNDWIERVLLKNEKHFFIYSKVQNHGSIIRYFQKKALSIGKTFQLLRLLNC